MGGRIASMLLEQTSARACVCLGYPFHPPGKPDSLRTEHLQKLSKPLLILQGERDPFGKKQEVKGYALSSTVQVDWIADGEHSFKPRKKSGFSLQGNLGAAVDKIAIFLTKLSD